MTAGVELYDGNESYCRMLGHAVPFRYCRAVADDLPCRLVADCWHVQFDAAGWLREHFTPGQIEKILTPPRPKIASGIDREGSADRAECANVNSSMTARDLMVRTLRFQSTPRPARDLWTLPWAERKYGGELEAIRRDFPSDIAYAPVQFPRCNGMRGDPCAIGTFVDEWGCEFINIQEGVIGEVKHPLVRDYDTDLDKVRPPWQWTKRSLDVVHRTCERSDQLIGSCLCFRLFERMQFLRGTENLYVDLLEQPAGLLKMTARIHEFNLAMIDAWAKTPVDFILGMDDWGSQRSLLINPRLWREFFKPMYAEYARRIKAAGKFVFFHSDGYIFDIYEDLIEIGFDAVNSQLFCMDIEEIARRFKGRLTFWGEIDRQHILPSPRTADVREAVHRVARALYDGHGGVIAQCEFGAGARPENVRAVYEEWGKYQE